MLSFGAEAEEDEEESMKVNEKFSGKGKSSHDVLGTLAISLFKAYTSQVKSFYLADPKLLPTTEEITPSQNTEDQKEEESSDTDPEERLENIRKKLRTGKPVVKKAPPPRKLSLDEDEEDEEEDERKKK